MSQIDTKDIFTIFFLLKSAEDLKNFKYSIVLKEWTEDKMSVKVDFVNPLGVSQGLQQDQFYLKIKDHKMFVSKETGESIRPENVQLLTNIPQ